MWGGGEIYFYSYFRQCCGSGMFIPDPGSRIQKQQQKREVKKNICQKAVKKMVVGSGIRDPRSGIRKKCIPDPGSSGQKAPNPGSRIRIRNTDFR